MQVRHAAATAAATQVLELEAGQSAPNGVGDALVFALVAGCALQGSASRSHDFANN